MSKTLLLLFFNLLPSTRFFGNTVEKRVWNKGLKTSFCYNLLQSSLRALWLVPLDWQLERSSKDAMAQDTLPGGQVLLRIQKENVGMLQVPKVPKERWKGDGGKIRCVSWDRIPA